jgi:hypothetical protein
MELYFHFVGTVMCIMLTKCDLHRCTYARSLYLIIIVFPTYLCVYFHLSKNQKKKTEPQPSQKINKLYSDQNVQTN